MKFMSLLRRGGSGVSVEPKNPRFAFAWMGISPKGTRFTNGDHTVRCELDQEWDDVIGFLELEDCPDGCAECLRLEREYPKPVVDLDDLE